MERIFRVNGKIFTNEEEAVSYEKELKRQEEERQAKERVKTSYWDQIQSQLKVLQGHIDKYEKETGDKLYFYNTDGKLKIVKSHSVNDFWRLMGL